MITSSATLPLSSFSPDEFDIFVYGLGYEGRSTTLASTCVCPTFAIQMDGPLIHASHSNSVFARAAGHTFVKDDLVELKQIVLTLLERQAPLRIDFDFSSINRAILFELLAFFAFYVRDGDALICYYVTAQYHEPDQRFPQIESFGPSNSAFSGFQSDPTLPLCLILGAGYEAGVTMGMISQLEPEVSYCLWGSGADERFDRTVQKANFDFRYPGYDVRSINYPLTDPMSTFSILENMVFGLSKKFRVVIAPMGPKIFSLISALVGIEHFGAVSVWRIKHSRSHPSPANPSGVFTSISVDISMLLRFSAQQREISLMGGL